MIDFTQYKKTPTVPATSGTIDFSKYKKAPVSPAPQSMSNQLGQGAAGDFSRGFVKSIGRMGIPFEGALDQTLGRVINAATGKGFVPTNTANQAKQVLNAPSQNLAEGAGDVVGTVAPYLIPGEGEANLARGGSKVLGFIARKAPSFLKNTIIGGAQTDSVKQGVETGVGGEVLSGAGRALGAVGKGIYKTLAIPTSATEARLLQAYKARVPFFQRMSAALSGDGKAPITADDTAFRKGFFGTESMIGVQAKRATSALWNKMIAPALKADKQPVDLQKFFTQAREAITSNTKELGDREARLKALDSIMEEYKAKPTALLEELQGFKEGWTSHVPEKYYRGQDITQTYNNVRAELSDLARTTIYDRVPPEVKQAYIDYGNLKSLSEWGQKAMTGGKFKGGAGSFISALKDAIITPVATAGGQTIYKVGQGMRFIGAPGARYLSDLFNEESQAPPQ